MESDANNVMINALSNMEQQIIIEAQELEEIKLEEISVLA